MNECLLLRRQSLYSKHLNSILCKILSVYEKRQMFLMYVHRRSHSWLEWGGGGVEGPFLGE